MGRGMNPEEQRIAIAKACGWAEYDIGWGRKHEFGYVILRQLPDYLNDLNAMRGALLTLPDDAPWSYYLSQVIWEEDRTKLVTDMMRAKATAAQMARAFLEIKGLWKP